MEYRLLGNAQWALFRAKKTFGNAIKRKKVHQFFLTVRPLWFWPLKLFSSYATGAHPEAPNHTHMCVVV